MREGSRARGCLVLIRNLTFAFLLYGLIFSTIQLIRSPGLRAKSKQRISTLLSHPAKELEPEKVKTTSAGQVKVKFAGSTQTLTLNPHANVFNRPESAVLPNDAFLGKRPHVDTEADVQLLVNYCRGTYGGLEKIGEVYNCLRWYAEHEDEYYYLPERKLRASEQDPRTDEYHNSTGLHVHGSKFVSVSYAKAASGASIGTCPGPIVPYHTYWTGPATWRVEVFIKSYLHTQNLACSRLYLWLDADRHPNAVEDFVTKDPLFKRFLPLVKRGDVIVKAWKFPNRIPVPNDQDNTDGAGYYKNPGKPNAKGEVAVADGIIQDASGQQFMVLTPKQMTFLPVAVSDAVRFVVLHQYGGAYFDMDVLMMRDMRPLLLPKGNHSFAERWGAHPHPGEYNTAIMSLTANSSLSSYLLRGGVRMGVNFHPRVIGRMAWKDGRDQEFRMFETAAFDPVWTEFNDARVGKCTVPCFKDYTAAFKGQPGAIKDEWESYEGHPLKIIKGLEVHPGSTHHEPKLVRRGVTDKIHDAVSQLNPAKKPDVPVKDGDQIIEPEPADSLSPSHEEITELKKAGIVLDYDIEIDKFPPNNRTLENFFKGAWTYHIHNQWLKHPQPSSWIDVIEKAHDRFFSGKSTNPYGEKWDGPALISYDKWPEYL